MKLKYSQQEHEQRQLRRYEYQRPKTTRIYRAMQKEILRQAKELGQFSPHQLRRIGRMKAAHECLRMFKAGLLVRLRKHKMIGWGRCQPPLYKAAKDLQ